MRIKNIFFNLKTHKKIMMCGIHYFITKFQRSRFDTAHNMTKLENGVNIYVIYALK